MMWLFVWSVLPLGALMVAAMLSGNALAMSLGSRLLAVFSPKLGFLKLSLPAFFSAVSSVLGLISYFNMCRNEGRREAANLEMGGLVAASTEDRLQMRVAYAQRDFYMCLYGCSLWLVVWRLKVLYEQQRLVARPSGALRPPPSTRIAYALLGICGLLLADIPICRLNYNMQLSWVVSLSKAKLQWSSHDCSDIMKATAIGDCVAFCEEVEKLSQERRDIVLWARRQHPLGGRAAEIFDQLRGVQQTDERIEDLFGRKSCAKVLKSVDKSNQLVNGLCLVCASLAVMGCFSAIACVFESRISTPESSSKAPIDAAARGKAAPAQAKGKAEPAAARGKAEPGPADPAPAKNSSKPHDE